MHTAKFRDRSHIASEYKEAIDVQKDPYKYLLTAQEKQSAHGYIPRLLLQIGVPSLVCYRFFRNSGQTDRFMRIKLPTSLVLTVFWKATLSFLLATYFGSKLFINRNRVIHHKMAKNEISKIMRLQTEARPYLEFHQKSNSLW